MERIKFLKTHYALINYTYVATNSGAAWTVSIIGKASYAYEPMLNQSQPCMSCTNLQVGSTSFAGGDVESQDIGIITAKIKLTHSDSS